MFPHVCLCLFDSKICVGVLASLDPAEEENGNRFGFPISRNLNFNQLLVKVREGPQHCTAAPLEHVCVVVAATSFIPKYSFY